MSWFWWFRKKGPITKAPQLSIITIAMIRCEECGLPLQNGDLVFRFEHMQDGKKIGQHVVNAHADCMVETSPFGRVVLIGKHNEERVRLRHEAWEAWKAAASKRPTG